MKRSPAAAFWLSLLPGLGHLYLGQTRKGLVLALVTVGLLETVDRGADALGIFIPIYWLFVMLDAHRSAQEINRRVERGEPLVDDGLAVGRSVWWGWTLVGIGVLLLLSNLGILDLDWVLRLWPVALIVVGVRLLRGGEPSPPPPAAPPTGPEQARTNEAGVEGGSGPDAEE